MHLVGLYLFAAFPDELPGSALRSLCKPVYSAWQPGLFICGTEEQAPGRLDHNCIVFGRTDFERREIAIRDTESGALAIWTHAVHDEVRRSRVACACLKFASVTSKHEVAITMLCGCAFYHPCSLWYSY